MAQPRTIRTLVALVVCMTLGTVALVAMQTEPIRSPLFELAAVTHSQPDMGQILQADLPIDEQRWNNIIWYEGPETAALAGRCHFVIHLDSQGGSTIEAQAAWKQQQITYHAVAGGPKDWNADSIGIYVVRNGQSRAAVRNALQRICPLLQEYCRIPSDRLYNQTDLGLH
ncbi:MAG: hypothetical protein ACOCZE_07795 [Planctomycetota bacterium]